MDDLYEKIKKQRRGFVWLAGKLPGFAGYMEATSRRTADRMLREHVAGQFKQLRDEFVNVETRLLRAGGLSYMGQTKSIKTRYQTLIDRIATDAPGYAGFLAANKVTDDDLQNVYAFDEAMIRYTEDISEGINRLAEAVDSNNGIPEALNHLENLMLEANQAYDLRDDVLKGIS